MRKQLEAHTMAAESAAEIYVNAKAAAHYGRAIGVAERGLHR